MNVFLIVCMMKSISLLLFAITFYKLFVFIVKFCFSIFFQILLLLLLSILLLRNQLNSHLFYGFCCCCFYTIDMFTTSTVLSGEMHHEMQPLLLMGFIYMPSYLYAHILMYADNNLNLCLRACVRACGSCDFVTFMKMTSFFFFVFFLS